MATKYKCSCGKKGCMKCGGKLPKAKNGGDILKYVDGGEFLTAGIVGITDTTSQLSNINNSELTGDDKGDAQVDALYSGLNTGLHTLPGVGQVMDISSGLASTIKRDENGNPITTGGKISNEIFKPVGRNVANRWKTADSGWEKYNAVAFEATGINALGRGLTGLLGVDDKTRGFWGGVNRFVGNDENLSTGVETPNDPNTIHKPFSLDDTGGAKGYVDKIKQDAKNRKNFDAKKASFMNPQVSGVKPQVDDTLGWMKFGGNLNVFNYNGNSHAQGGINVNAQGLPTKQFGGQPVAEVEGGETMAKLEQGGNTPFIFSDKLKSTTANKTFAELHKPLVNMEKRMTKNAERVSSNPITKQSQERMKERIMNNTKALAQEQEHMKMIKDMGKTKVMKNGGKLPKYELGSENEYDWSTNVGNFIPESNVGGMSVGSNAKGTSYNPNTNYNMWQTNDNGFNILEPQYKSSTYNTSAYGTDTPTSIPDYNQADSTVFGQGNVQGQGTDWNKIGSAVMNNIGPAMQIAYQNRVANQKLNKDMFPEIQNPRTAEVLGELDKSKDYLGKYFGYDIKEQLAELDRTGRASMENARNVSRGSANVALAHDYGTRSRTTAAKNQLRERYENAEKAKNLQASDAYMKYANMLGLLGDTERQVKQGQEDRYSGALANQTKYRDAMYSNMGKLSEENQREKYQWAALESMSPYYKVDKATGKTYFDAEAYNKANS